MSAASDTRPVLYILPGLLCDESIFEIQKRELADICDVRSPSFAGFDSIVGMAQFIIDQAPPKFSLAGFSMGGRVALQVMRLAGERVERLCLFDTGATAEPAGGGEKRKALVDLAHERGMAALASVWLPPMLAPSRRQDEAFKKPIVDMIERFSPEDHEKQIKALVERPDARPVLATIKCPTMVICGEEDEWSTPEQHREMADDIAGSRLEIIKGAGHFVSVEQPAAFTKLMREFMAMGAN